MSKFTKRGVQLPSFKEPAASRPIIDISQPAQVFVPLLTGDGTDCRPAIPPYETVKQGDVLGQPTQTGEYPVLSPVSGVLSDLREISHPQLGNITCAVIDCTGMGGEHRKKKSTGGLTAENILALAGKAGILDELDGAPLADKLKEWRKDETGLLVADGSEQEPYSSSAWTVLGESAEQVRDGLKLAASTIGATHYHIAVRRLSKEKVSFTAKLQPEELFIVHGKYPAGLVHRSTDQPIRRIGVQACLALYRAAAYGEAQNTCVVTVTGDAVANPQNIRVPVGTLAEDILHFCGLAANPECCVFGDAMTGIAISRLDIPVTPGISCLLALKARPVPPEHTCVGCGRCVHVCHADLMPFEIMRRLENMQYERLSSLEPERCDGCGACSYVCPSGLDVTAKVLEAQDAHGTIFLKWGDKDDL